MRLTLVSVCAQCGTYRELGPLKGRGVEKLGPRAGDDSKIVRYRVWRKCDKCPSHEVKVRIAFERSLVPESS